ncbi:hypothetical protein MYSTI_01755 [Myxococcus stipitatus DSM 14675]|uniref:Uncharacterized protein n=2 Tax=Myxococcus stipitatus TaxID=83455 RepID=L7U665_MYXSD|nr:hypothetical protein MYSTI_01755 [Myxococcus stipitatus DSM 14675]
MAATRNARRRMSHGGGISCPLAVRAALFTWVLLFATSATAQTLEDRAYVGFTLARGTDIGPRGSSLDERQQLDLRLPLPPLFLGRTVLVPTVGYETRWMGLERKGLLADMPEDEDLGRRFHVLQMGLTLIRPVAPRWMVMMGAMASTRTDFRSPYDFGLDTNWAGFAMASYLVGGDPGVRVTFGLVALYPFDISPVFPMASFVYRKGPYILELGLPRLAMLLKVGDGLEVGLTGAFDQQVFRTRMPQAPQGPHAHYVRETQLRVGPTVNARLGGGSLWVSSSIGLDVLNDYALLDRNRDRVDVEMLRSTRPAPYLRVSLGWRPPRRPSTASRLMAPPPPETPSVRGNTSPLAR